MADPLTALMYAVQVMNFLKTLIVKTLQDREDSVVEPAPVSRLEPSDENGHNSSSKPRLDTTSKENDEVDPSFITDEPVLESASDSSELDNVTDGDALSDSTSIEGFYEYCYSDHFSAEIEAKMINDLKRAAQENSLGGKIGQSSIANLRKGPGIERQPVLQVMGHVEKSKEICNLSRINSRTEWIEAWR